MSTHKKATELASKDMKLGLSGKRERDSSKTQRTETSNVPLILSIAVLGGLIASYFIFPSYQRGIDEAFSVLTSEDPELIREWVSQFGLWGPSIVLIAFVLQMFLFIIPNVLLILICILSYGPVWGGLLAWTGIVIASTVGFFLGNKLSPVTVHKLVSAKTQQMIKQFIEDYGMKAVFVFRLSSMSNDGLSLVAGLLNMKFRRFMLATVLGITPLITVLAIVGRKAKIEKGLVWVGLVLVLGLVVYIVVDRRRRKKRKSDSGLH